MRWTSRGASGSRTSPASASGATAWPRRFPRPPETDDDKALLVAYLTSARRHVRAVLDGVFEADRHRPLVPSGWSMVGLVQHLPFDVERFWFRVVMTERVARRLFRFRTSSYRVRNLGPFYGTGASRPGSDTPRTGEGRVKG
ncbi:MAG: mycothiol transferase [Propionibacteriaceae bacterium]